MKRKFKLILQTGLLALLFSGGCFHDDTAQPEPVTLPYALPVPVPEKAPETSEARIERIANEVTSGISLQMALSGQGPYRLVLSGKSSPLREKIFHGLYSMGLIRYGENIPVLYYTENRKENTLQIFLGKSPGKNDFYTYTAAAAAEQEKTAHAQQK